jgi:hypothetical protein
MSAGNVIIALLKADAQLLAAFGPRIRVGKAGPIDARPYCLVTQILSNPAVDLAGESGLEISTIQVDVYCDTRSELTQLTNRVVAVLKATPRGKFANTWVSSLMRSDGPREIDERIGDGAEDFIARSTIDYRVHWAN